MLVGLGERRARPRAGRVRVELERDGELVASVPVDGAAGGSSRDVPPGEYRVGAGARRLRRRSGSAHASGPTQPPLRLRLLSRRADRVRVATLGPRRRAGRAALPRGRAVSAEPVALRARARAPARSSAGTTSTARGRSCRSRPTATYTQTGVGWNRVGYGGNPHHTLARDGAAAERPLLRPRRGRVGRVLRGAVGRRAGRGSAARSDRGAVPRRTPGTRTTTSAAAATTSTPPACRRARP